MLNKTARDLRWKQDLGSVTVEFELKRTSLSKITVSVGRRFVRVTCPEKSFAKVVDLHEEVKFDPQFIKTTYEGDWLTISLQKSSKGLWDTLWVEGLTREDLQQRREQDIKELEQIARDKHETSKVVKQEQVSIVTKESMRIDETKRQIIEARKEAEKRQAIEEIFRPEPPKVAEKPSKKENMIWDESDLQEDSIQEPTIRQYQVQRGEPQEEQMDETPSVTLAPQVQELPKVSKPIPSVRSVPKSEPIQLEFTERIFPTLAMRESQLKEAPAPKLRKLAQKMDKNMDSTLKSPIWLKDKGDEFLQGGDYASAIDAYNNAIKLDPTYWAAYSNRSICHLQLHNIEDCAQECGFLLAKFIQLEKDEQMTGQIHRLREKVYLRALTCEALLGRFQQYKELAEVLLREAIISESNKPLIQKDLEVILKREEAFKQKAEADQTLKQGHFQQAKEMYTKILEENADDKLNDRILANLSHCEMKLGQFDEAIISCSVVIDLIQAKLSRNLSQTAAAKHVSHFKNLLIKLLLRRAHCLEAVQRQLDAETDLRSILLLDERNEEARTFRKRLASKREFDEAVVSKQIGDQALREGNHSEALNKYRFALTTFDPSKHIFEYLAVLLNMSVCHTALNMTEEVLTDCIKGLRVLEKVNNSVIKLTKDTWTPEERTKLSQMELRFYMRRANAFLQKGQIYHAKSGFENVV